MKLDPQKVRASLRRLYETGLYQTIDVEGERHGDQVIIIFAGSPRMFLGRIEVNGVKNDRRSSQLVRATKLNAGTPFSQTKLNEAHDALIQTLQEDGYYQPKISVATKDDLPNSQTDVIYQIDTGKNPRVGAVTVNGDSGMNTDSFRNKGKAEGELQGHSADREPRTDQIAQKLPEEAAA